MRAIIRHHDVVPFPVIQLRAWICCIISHLVAAIVGPDAMILKEDDREIAVRLIVLSPFYEVLDRRIAIVAPHPKRNCPRVIAGNTQIVQVRHSCLTGQFVTFHFGYFSTYEFQTRLVLPMCIGN